MCMRSHQGIVGFGMTIKVIASVSNCPIPQLTAHQLIYLFVSYWDDEGFHMVNDDSRLIFGQLFPFFSSA
jgi:hypothetical protein